MATENKHTLHIDDGRITVSGVTKVVEVDDKNVVLQTDKGKLTVKGTGINVIKLEQADGIVVFESESVQSVVYSGGAKSLLKGLLG